MNMDILRQKSQRGFLQMNKIWITSDLHFGHQQNFLWAPRGFSSIDEHDKQIIKNWNELVADNDIVYVLGDLMLNDDAYGRSCFNQLKGFKYLVIGNHDTDTRLIFYPFLKGVEDVQYAYRLQYKKYHFFLTHYPTLTGNFDDKKLHTKIINLCGHTHTKDPFIDLDKGIIYHCELDAHNNYPIALDKIIEDIKIKYNEVNENE